MWNEISDLINKRTKINVEHGKLFKQCHRIITKVTGNENINKAMQADAIVDAVRKEFVGVQPANAERLLKQFIEVEFRAQKGKKTTATAKAHLKSFEWVQKAVHFILQNPLEIELRNYRDDCDAMLEFLERKGAAAESADRNMSAQYVKVQQWRAILDDDGRSVSDRLLDFKSFIQDKRNQNILKLNTDHRLKSGLRKVAARTNLLSSFAKSSHNVFHAMRKNTAVSQTPPVLDDIAKSGLNFSGDLVADLLPARQSIDPIMLQGLHANHQIIIAAKTLPQSRGFHEIDYIVKVLREQNGIVDLKHAKQFEAMLATVKLPVELQQSNSAQNITKIQSALALIKAVEKVPNLAQLPKPLNQEMVNDLACLMKDDPDVPNQTFDISIENLTLIQDCYNETQVIAARLNAKLDKWGGDDVLPETIAYLKEKYNIDSADSAHAMYAQFEQLDAQLPEELTRGGAGYRIINRCGALGHIEFEMRAAEEAQNHVRVCLG